MQWFPAQSVLEIFLSLGRVSSSRQDAVQQLTEAVERGLNVEGRQDEHNRIPENI